MVTFRLSAIVALDKPPAGDLAMARAPGERLTRAEKRAPRHYARMLDASYAIAFSKATTALLEWLGVGSDYARRDPTASSLRSVVAVRSRRPERILGSSPSERRLS